MKDMIRVAKLQKRTPYRLISFFQKWTILLIFGLCAGCASETIDSKNLTMETADPRFSFSPEDPNGMDTSSTTENRTDVNPSDEQKVGGAIEMGPLGGSEMNPMGGVNDNPMGGVDTAPIGGSDEITGGEYIDVMGGTEPLGGVMEAECNPNTQYGPCEICDEGSFSYPLQDDRCSTALVCPTEHYTTETTAEGLLSCYREVLSAPETISCVGIGQCDEPTECQIQERIELISGNACQIFSGCENTTPPEISDLPDGAICHQWGQCQNGICSAPNFCAQFPRYNQENFFCEGGTSQDGRLACVFYVNRSGNTFNDGDEITCNQFCENAGTSCIDGWNNRGISCSTGDHVGCDERLRDQICMCDVSVAGMMP